jgi:hypothetical protein
VAKYREGCWGGTDSTSRSSLSLQAKSGRTGGKGDTSEGAGTRGGQERGRSGKSGGSKRRKDWTLRGRSFAEHGGRGVITWPGDGQGGGECRRLVHTTDRVLGPRFQGSSLARLVLNACPLPGAGG